MLHYTIDDGLPSNTVYSVYRDSRGFLWIATDIGICRYNGIKFQTFTTDDGMPDNEIFFFQEDHEGRLWLATFNGELCYYKNGFHNAKNTSFLKLPFKSTQIKNINIEKDSSVTIMFDDQGKFINIKGNQTRVVYIPSDLDNNNYLFLSKLSPSSYRFLHRDSVVTIDTGNHITSIRYGTFPENTVLPGGWKIVNAQDQRYILNGTRVFNRDLSCIYYFKDKWGKSKINTVYFDNDNRIFINTDSGIYTGNNVILNKLEITSMTQGIANNYWIGTHNEGLFVLDYKYAHSSFYNNVYQGEIRYAFADSGKLFYTTSENSLYELKNDKTECIFNYKKYRDKKLETGQNHGFLITKNCKTNTYDYYNYYLGSTAVVNDLENARKTSTSHSPLNSGEIVKSIIDLDDKIYIRTIKKIYSVAQNQFINSSEYIKTGKLEADNNDRIFAFARSYNNEIWYSIRNGVFKLKDNGKQLQKQFKDITFKKFEFFNQYLIGHTDVDNRLLVCSSVNDSIIIDTIAQQNCIWSLFYKLDSIHMLITTNSFYRLFTINPPGSKTKYTVAAIESPFVPLRAEFVASDNENCYFFVNGSITKIKIENLLQKPKAPQVFFKSLVYGNGNVQIRDGGYKKISFRGAKNISISFSTLSFTGKDIFYQYSFSSGTQDVWQNISGEEINLADQHYGKFTIKIRAKSISSEFSKPIQFQLEIAPPYWATWWFLLICSLVTTGLIILIVRYRILWVLQKNKKENDTKIRFMKSEYKALNALMNPHFIFNTLNNVQGLVNRNDKLAANEYLRIFADLVRQNMHNVSKEMIPLQKEIDLVANYLALEKLRFKELLNYSINVDDEVDTAVIMVPPLFIQPLVENSIKHGILPRQSEDSCIQLNVYETGDILHIEVKDNGVGLSAAKKKANPLHESFGLRNIQDRIEQLSIILGKKIEFKIEEVQEESGQWTVVSIEITF